MKWKLLIQEIVLITGDKKSKHCLCVQDAHSLVREVDIRGITVIYCSQKYMMEMCIGIYEFARDVPMVMR